MNIIIDAGNTCVKLAIFDKDELIFTQKVSYNNLKNEIFKLIKEYNVKNGILSSVGRLENEVVTEIKTQITLIELNSETNIPFKNLYETPKTLGVDRIALNAGAVTKFPNKNVLVIDAGTCITYDFVNHKSEYLGGAISPGIEMRYKSLNHFTAKLPKLEAKLPNNFIGNSTHESIHVGIVNGVISEIDSFINQYKEKKANLTVVLTGGDVNFLSNSIKNTIFANPNFLLEGLNSILTYNL